MLGLRRNADIRTLCFVGTYFGLVAFAWRLGWVAWWVNLPLMWVIWFFSFAGAVAVHNAIHCPTFYAKSANKVFQIVLSMVYGHPVSSYVPGHNLSHHKFTQETRDVMRTSKLRFRWHFLNGILFGAKIGYDMLGNDKAYFAAQKRLGRPIYKQMCLEWYCLYSYLAVLVLLDWTKVVWIILIPHIFSKLSIISLNILQHDGCDMSHKYNFARNFTSPLLNFWFYNNGYHGIHHMMPGKHWSILPELHNERIKPGIDPALDQPSILLYMWRTFVWPGVRVDFKGQPVDIGPDVPDEPWFYDMQETYSTKEDFVE